MSSLTRPAIVDVLTVVNDLLIDHDSPEAKSFAACLQSALVRSYARAEQARADRRINDNIRGLNAMLPTLSADTCTMSDDCFCVACDGDFVKLS